MDSGPKILNNKGSVSLVAILFFLAFFAIIFSNMARSYEELQIIKFYNRSYICAKKTTKAYKDFYDYISYTNLAIKSLFYSKFFPLTTWVAVLAKYGEKALKVAQLIYRGYFRIKLYSITECRVENLLQLTLVDPLGKNIFWIKRRLDGEAVLAKKWKVYMPFHYQGSSLSENHSFMMQLNFTLDSGMLMDDFKLSSKHLGIKGFQQLKDFYGLQFL